MLCLRQRLIGKGKYQFLRLDHYQENWSCHLHFMTFFITNGCTFQQGDTRDSSFSTSACIIRDSSWTDRTFSVIPKCPGEIENFVVRICSKWHFRSEKTLTGQEIYPFCSTLAIIHQGQIKSIFVQLKLSCQARKLFTCLLLSRARE